MISASFGSATRQTVRNRMRRTTTATAAMITYVQSISPPGNDELDGASDVDGPGRVVVDDDYLGPYLDHLVDRWVSVEGFGGTPHRQHHLADDPGCDPSDHAPPLAYHDAPSTYRCCSGFRQLTREPPPPLRPS